MSLFGGKLGSAVAKAAFTARTYAAMADGCVQAGLQCPKPPRGSRGVIQWVPYALSEQEPLILQPAQQAPPLQKEGGLPQGSAPGDVTLR